MKFEEHRPKHWHLATLAHRAGCVCLTVAFALGAMSGLTGVAGAAPLGALSPTLGAAGSFSVLAGTTVTNTGPTNTSGAVGVSPGTSITNFPPGTAGGGTHSNDSNAISAQGANGGAFGALDQACTTTYPGVKDLGGLNLVPGVYCATAFQITGNLTLSGSGVWIFKSDSTLNTASNASVSGGDPCNVWWRLGSSGSLGTGSHLIGNILALTSISLATGASVDGRALAQTGAVTLDDNSVTGPGCAQAATPIPSLPSYVDVAYPCSTDPATVTVTVGLSAGVIVYGLGADITSATDTGANKIVRVLPFGHYAWHAVAPAGHYLVSVTSGVVDAFLCPSSVPGATAAPTASATGVPTTSGTASPTAVPVLIAVTGADLAGGNSLAARRLLQGSLGFLGLGLVLVGVTLWRKRE
jgi:Ice-binding-like